MFRTRLSVLLAAGVAFGCSEPTASKTAEPVGSLLRASATGGPVVHHVPVRQGRARLLRKLGCLGSGRDRADQAVDVGLGVVDMG